MCKNNNRCFYDYNSTLSPEALVLTEAIPFINANREENERVSLDDLLQVLNSDIDNTITEISEPENILEDDPVEETKDIVEEEQEEIIQASESEDECDNDIKYTILMSILNRTYMPIEYKEDDIVILRELYKTSENDYVKQLLKEALLKLVYETIK